MSWCFGGQSDPFKRTTNLSSNSRPNRDHITTEPTKIGLLYPSWPPIQESWTARISSPYADSLSNPAPVEVSQVRYLVTTKLTSREEIIFITATCPHHDDERFQLDKAKFTALVLSAGGTTTKILDYHQVQSTPGWPEAIARFQANPDAPLSFNHTPRLEDLTRKPEGGEALSEPGRFLASKNYFLSLPSLLSTLPFKWPKWGGLFRRRDSHSLGLSETTLRPPYEYPVPS
jgi:hypothetical protein